MKRKPIEYRDRQSRKITIDIETYLSDSDHGTFATILFHDAENTFALDAMFIDLAWQIKPNAMEKCLGEACERLAKCLVLDGQYRDHALAGGNSHHDFILLSRRPEDQGRVYLRYEYDGQKIWIDHPLMNQLDVQGNGRLLGATPQ